MLQQSGEVQVHETATGKLTARFRAKPAKSWMMMRQMFRRYAVQPGNGSLAWAGNDRILHADQHYLNVWSASGERSAQWVAQ